LRIAECGSRIAELPRRFAGAGPICYTPPAMANISDVAKEARVSLATVSAVVNESAYVSPETPRRLRRQLSDDRRPHARAAPAPASMSRGHRHVTCDDHPWLDSFRPRLTTVNLPKYELGQAAAKTLVRRLQPGDAPPGKRRRVVTLKTVLCLRESCGYEMKRGNPV